MGQRSGNLRTRNPGLSATPSVVVFVGGAMGVWKFTRSRAVVPGNMASLWCFVALSAVAGTGCQQTSHVVHRRLIEHQAMIDFSGLKPVELIENVNVRAAIPRNWDTLEAQSNALYTHQQWR